jgi:hypothetical protein
MSDWKARSIKRKDFRNSKTDPEIAKHKGKKNKKHTHKLIIEEFGWFNTNEKTDYVFGKYRSKTAAEEAMTQKTNDSRFWGKYKMRVEEI